MAELPPPPDRKGGWYPDPEGSGRLRFWNKRRWTDDFRDEPGVANSSESGDSTASRPPTKRGHWGGAPWWAWVVGVIVGLTILGAIVGDDNPKNDSGGSNSAATEPAQTGSSGTEVADEPTGDAEGSGSCPQQTFVGLPINIRLTVTNTGDKIWPVTYLTIDDGADHFVFNNAHMGSLVAQKVDTPAFDTWQLGADGSGLRPGEKGKIAMTLTPKDAGNRDLSYGVWGGPVDDGPMVVPNDLKLVSCSAIPVNP